MLQRFLVFGFMGWQLACRNNPGASQVRAFDEEKAPLASEIAQKPEAIDLESVVLSEAPSGLGTRCTVSGTVKLSKTKLSGLILRACKDLPAEGSTMRCLEKKSSETENSVKKQYYCTKGNDEVFEWELN